MVVEVIEKINTPVKMVEDAASCMLCVSHAANQVEGGLAYQNQIFDS
jgi:hypothetical protein